MKYLLDVSVLLAAIWKTHPQHEAASQWLAGKTVAVCPLVELGFIRISSNPKVFNALMPKTRQLLAAFMSERKAGWIPDDLPALDSSAKGTQQVMDNYLASLAEKHGLKLATLDHGLKHHAAVLVG